MLHGKQIPFHNITRLHGFERTSDSSRILGKTRRHFRDGFDSDPHVSCLLHAVSSVMAFIRGPCIDEARSHWREQNSGGRTRRWVGAHTRLSFLFWRTFLKSGGPWLRFRPGAVRRAVLSPREFPRPLYLPINSIHTNDDYRFSRSASLPYRGIAPGLFFLPARGHVPHETRAPEPASRPP